MIPGLSILKFIMVIFMSEIRKTFDIDREKYSKQKILSLILFYLLPGWRNPEFSKQEYEIEKIKSKRRFFRHLINPLTIIGGVAYGIPLKIFKLLS